MTEQQQKPTEIHANTIEALRWAIDQADAELVALLNQRAEYARRIGVLKGASDSVAFVPARERAVLDHAVSVNQGPLPDEAIRGIFQQIIAASRNLEQPVRVAYFGPEFTNTHYAALQRFGATAHLIAAESISEVIEPGRASSPSITAWCRWRIPPRVSSAKRWIRCIARHCKSPMNCRCPSTIPYGVADRWTKLPPSIRIPQPLAQCRTWLQTHLPHAKLSPPPAPRAPPPKWWDGATRRPSAIPLAGEHFGLTLLADHLEDSPYNRTRFCIIGPAMSQPSGHDKTSIVFSVKHLAGALNHALAILERHHINLTLIESRPTKEMPWEYVFYVDIQGHISEEKIIAALDDLREHCIFVRVFGSYPEAT